MKITYSNFFGIKEIVVSNEKELFKILKNLNYAELQGEAWDIKVEG